ncbi:hypothetical protein DAPPUDRAFT_254686 [Daphnia pulex]|uniref:Uncharacterized protein n=1 Tax=Daphnia pulex TaxID=6669 RepID=E9H7M7_DAPPU|nr:hypothetical protein DAPPUDRAFT_254686 [Daphnia pulex]|eukprot:EFX72210.1 hypothetical protein DAPPUDRAFT_254686 [Daphnia pulex]
MGLGAEIGNRHGDMARYGSTQGSYYTVDFGLKCRDDRISTSKSRFIYRVLFVSK